MLAAIHVTKIVYSTADSFAVLKFLADGTQAFEAEGGLTINEPGTLAVKATIEAAVVELIKEGERKGIWDYRKTDTVPAPVAPPVVVTPPVTEPPKKIETLAVKSVQDPVRMYFVSSTRVYKKKSQLDGPLYGPFVTVLAGTKCMASETEFDGVVEIRTESGIQGYVRREKLKADK